MNLPDELQKIYIDSEYIYIQTNIYYILLKDSYLFTYYHYSTI